MLLQRCLSYEKTENGYLIRGDAADVLLIFMSDDVVRIRVSFDRNMPEESYTLVTTAWEDRMDALLRGERVRIRALDVPCTETPEALVFHTKTMRLELLREPFSFRLYAADGTRVYQDLPGRAFERDHLGRKLHYSRLDWEHDHFYGFGEKTGHLDKKGRRLRMSPKDAIGHDPENGDPMYKHIPFYIRTNDVSRHAVGLFYHNSFDSVFDLGQEISGYWPRYCFYQTDGGDIDLFLINGPGIPQILERYTWLTGRCAMPTKQSLGYCASTMYYAELERDCDQEIYRVVDQYDRENIPIDNFWLASGYSSGEDDNLRYVFHWNRVRFPHPEEFVRRMNARGINVICNLKPGILARHPDTALFEENDVFIKTPDGSGDYWGRWWGGAGRFFDFTNPAARRVWKELLEERILRMGTKTVWNDNCEMDGVEDRNARCDFDGASGTMAQLKILHSNLMAMLAREAIAEVYPGERPYIISRAGFAGIQRYAQVWGGDNLTDWRTLRFNIATILGMGLSGCANMGCDIGGFAGPAPEAELLLRWIQNGIFQPRFCINSANSDNTVTQPWMYPSVLDFIRQAYALRYRMLPYLYSLMYEASRNGMPAMRPLVLEFPDDPRTYDDRSLTFLFGRSVLVANVLEPGASHRDVYLPAGCSWYDMNDHLREYAGGQTVRLPVGPGSIPMFLRGDGIFVTGDGIERIEHSTVRQLHVLISAQRDCSFDLYDDDGHTTAYLTGDCAVTTVGVTAGERTRVRFSTKGRYPQTAGTFVLQLVSKEKGAFWVTVDGRRIPRFLVRGDWEDAERGWYYDPEDRSVLVRFPRPAKEAYDVVVSREKFDLIGMSDA